MSVWSPDSYLQFASERLKPIQDLIHRISCEQPEWVVDLGCGPGNSTAELRNRWPHAEIIGIDQSPEMLNKAKQSSLQANWLKADISRWQASDPVDILFANAVLHWLPNHEVLFPQLIAQLSTSGILAVQMPANLDAPLYQVVHELVDSAYWHKRFRTFVKAVTLEQTAFYYNVLAPLCSYIDIWETCYYHLMENHLAILNWFRGTGLRPYLAALANREWQEEFEQQILQGYQQTYPKQKNGYILFPFRRLFIVARR
ncbi:methyltransferase domain-containing protein [Zooshikella harenae]|uniref:Methyltransferase domain-containing protein n=1 Tax=Zooshikella harenae TaxID=2827238 RepID=A0ABS5ZDT3_9GAMM|nr:methyltransferase domain-containing protein [Zooshikella harenae]MBU2712224.1 methyltransferase domain-containing protein [Zooshikella harenae]